MTGSDISYNDAVAPSNNLRPDHGRKYEVFYWTISQLPQWFSARGDGEGWFPFLYVTVSDLMRMEVSITSLIPRIMRIFWNPALAGPHVWNFQTTGVRLNCCGRMQRITLSVGGFWADEAALEAILGCKGASGRKPCICCRNVIGRVPRCGIAAGLIHVTSPDLSNMKAHTHTNQSRRWQTTSKRRLQNWALQHQPSKSWRLIS